MKTVKRIIITAAVLIALTGLAFSAESGATGSVDLPTDTGSSTGSEITTTTAGGNSSGTCTDCFDP